MIIIKNLGGAILMGLKMILQGDTLTALLDGEIDHHIAKEIREAIDFEVSKSHPKLLRIDFSKIQFMDSSGIGLIMGRYKIMKSLNGKLLVTNASTQLNRLIKLSGLGALGVIEERSIEK